MNKNKTAEQMFPKSMKAIADGIEEAIADITTRSESGGFQMPDVDPRFLRQAEEDLPCDCGPEEVYGEGHFPWCHAPCRPIFAQRLQEAVASAERNTYTKLFALCDEHKDTIFQSCPVCRQQQSIAAERKRVVEECDDVAYATDLCGAPIHCGCKEKTRDAIRAHFAGKE